MTIGYAIRTSFRKFERRLWWPMRLRLHRRRMACHFIDWHGVEMGSEMFDNIGGWPFRRVVAQTFHFFWGHIQIQLGYRERR